MSLLKMPFIKKQNYRWMWKVQGYKKYIRGPKTQKPDKYSIKSQILFKWKSLIKFYIIQEDSPQKLCDNFEFISKYMKQILTELKENSD
jgi:uncharacterized short protein YbdD (DUF466 family)